MSHICFGCKLKGPDYQKETNKYWCGNCFILRCQHSGCTRLSVTDKKTCMQHSSLCCSCKTLSGIYTYGDYMYCIPCEKKLFDVSREANPNPKKVKHNHDSNATTTSSSTTNSSTTSSSSSSSTTTTNDTKEKEKESCCVCLSSPIINRTVIISNQNCLHVYCYTCIREWIIQQMRPSAFSRLRPDSVPCPLCRAPFTKVYTNFKSVGEYETKTILDMCTRTQTELKTKALTEIVQILFNNHPMTEEQQSDTYFVQLFNGIQTDPDIQHLKSHYATTINNQPFSEDQVESMVQVLLSKINERATLREHVNNLERYYPAPDFELNSDLTSNLNVTEDVSDNDFIPYINNTIRVINTNNNNGNYWSRRMYDRH